MPKKQKKCTCDVCQSLDKRQVEQTKYYESDQYKIDEAKKREKDRILNLIESCLDHPFSGFDSIQEHPLYKNWLGDKNVFLSVFIESLRIIRKKIIQ